MRYKNIDQLMNVMNKLVMISKVPKENPKFYTKSD